MLKVIQHLFILPLLISIVIGMKNLRLQWSSPYKIFFVLLVTVGIVESLSVIWTFCLPLIPNWPYKKDSLWIMNIGLIPQYLLYIAFFYKINHSKRVKKVLIIAAPAFIIFVIANWFLFQSINSINSYSLIVASSIIVGSALRYFDQLLKDKETAKEDLRPLIWISSAALLFHIGLIPYIYNLNYLIANNLSLALSLFYLFSFLNFTLYTCYTIALLCQPSPPKLRRR